MNENPTFKLYFQAIRKRLKKIIIVILAFVVAELLLTHLLPHILTETMYFRMYLPWVSIKKTQQFLDNHYDIVSDDLLGWRNKSSYVSKTICYDQFGSRSYKGISTGDSPKYRVIFMGDSRIGGYIYVNNEQTINACLEDETIETLNLGTNLYGLDQVYLLMQELIQRFKPDMIIICIGTDVGEVLNCHYLPFLHASVGEPLLKPRYIIENGSLVLHVPPVREFLESVPNSPKMLRYLKQHDDHYGRFQQFKKREITPLYNLCSLIQLRWRQREESLRKRLDFNQASGVKNFPMVHAIIDSIKQAATLHQTQLVFLLLPNREESGYQTLAIYDEIISLLKSKSILYIDIKSLLRRHTNPEQFFADRTHLTCAGNQVIANRIRQLIDELHR